MLIALGIVLARGSMAGELELGLVGDVGYDSSVYRFGGEDVPDVSYTLNPTIRLRKAESPFSYELLYAPSFVGYLENANVGAWDQRAALTVSRVFGGRTQVSADNRFWYGSRLQLRQMDQPGASDVDVWQARQMTNNAAVSVYRDLTPRMRVYAIFRYDIARYDQEVYTDWDYLSAALQFMRSLSTRDTLALGMSTGYRSYEPREGARLVALGPYIVEESFTSRSRTQTYYGFLSLEHNFSGDFGVTVQLGPSWTQSSRLTTFQPIWEDISPSPPAKASQGQLNWFGNVKIKKEWRRTRVSASYNRNESTIGGSDESAVVDTLSASASWEPDTYWRFQLMGQWSRQESGLSGGQSQRVTRWHGGGFVSRKLTRRSSISLSFGYRERQYDRSSRTSREAEYSARLGFHYDFSAIRF